MNMEQMQSSYEAIFSLGGTCRVAYHMQTNRLRGCSGPLDWFYFTDTNAMSQVLAAKFSNFMQLEHLEVYGEHEQFYLVKDRGTGCLSFHDFPVLPETQDNPLASYPAFRAKIDRRIHRFFSILHSAPSILFIRTDTSFEDAVQLYNILAGLTPNRIHLLIVTETNTEEIRQDSWSDDHICSVQFPTVKDTFGCKDSWNRMLQRFTLNGTPMKNIGLK